MVLEEISNVRGAGWRRTPGRWGMRLIHRRMDELAVAGLAVCYQPAAPVSFESISHRHAGSALLYAKRSVRLGLVTVDADRVNGHVHRGHIDAAVVPHMVLNRLPDHVGVTSRSNRGRTCGGRRAGTRIRAPCSRRRRRSAVLIAADGEGRDQNQRCGRASSDHATIFSVFRRQNRVMSLTPIRSVEVRHFSHPWPAWPHRSPPKSRRAFRTRLRFSSGTPWAAHRPQKSDVSVTTRTWGPAATTADRA
jgi:hypothetical protein